MILGCADEHNVALLLDNEKEVVHGTPERCSPAEYHNKKADNALTFSLPYMTEISVVIRQ